MLAILSRHAATTFSIGTEIHTGIGIDTGTDIDHMRVDIHPSYNS